MPGIKWSKYPLVKKLKQGREWLQILDDCGRSPNTIDAYGRGLNGFLVFSDAVRANPLEASRKDVAEYLRHLMGQSGRAGNNVLRLDSGAGLSNSTIQQRLTALRLWFDYLMEEGVRTQNPVGRGKFTRGGSFGSKRGIYPRISREPWIPNEDESGRFFQAAAHESLRNRLMLSIQYEGALRREELVGLRLADVDVAHRTIAVPAEITKGKTRGRHVVFSQETARLMVTYLQQRARLGTKDKCLFVSESHRNRNKGLTASAWDKVVRNIRERAEVPRITTHTMRHLRITDLARADWKLKELMEYAGHANPQTTLIYIHMSGRDIAHKFAAVDKRRAGQVAALAAELR